MQLSLDHRRTPLADRAALERWERRIPFSKALAQRRASHEKSTLGTNNGGSGLGRALFRGRSTRFRSRGRPGAGGRVSPFENALYPGRVEIAARRRAIMERGTDGHAFVAKCRLRAILFLFRV